MPQQRRFCPFCGREVQSCNRQVLRDAFHRLGPDLGDEETYVQVTIRPDGEDRYMVIGSMEPLKPFMQSTKVA